MASPLGDNFQVQLGKPLENKYLEPINNRPYNDINEVNTTIVEPLRFIGLTVNIDNEEYWYATGTTDTDLVIKNPSITQSGGITGGTNGLTKDGDNLKLGGSLTEATSIDNTSETITFNGQPVKYGGSYNFGSLDLITKEYVDSVAAGLVPKSAVKFATTQNIDLTGGTFTGDIDGITIGDTDRVLVKNQTGATENGIYVYNSTGNTFFRALDFDDSPDGEVREGSLVPVISGSTNGNTAWILVTDDPIDLGITELNFSLFSRLLDIVGGTGVTVNTTGGQRKVSVDLVDGGGLDFDTQNDSGQIRIASSFAGLGSDITSGVLNLNIEDVAATGTEINVQIDTGGTNQLMVDSNDVNIALGTPIISADNGLNKLDNTVVLGGALTGNTTIGLDGNGLVFGTGSSITNTVSVANLAIEDGLDTGALTDAVLVRENGTGIIKGVDSDLFGEDNNLYSLTSVTTTTLDENSFVILVDTSSSSQTVTLPASPADGRAYRIKDKSGSAFMNSITVTGGTIDGESSVSINTDHGAFDIVYSETDNEWYVLSFNN